MDLRLKRPAFGRGLLIAVLLVAAGVGGYLYFLRSGHSPPKRATLVRHAPAFNRGNMGLFLRQTNAGGNAPLWSTPRASAPPHGSVRRGLSPKGRPQRGRSKGEGRSLC